MTATNKNDSDNNPLPDRYFTEVALLGAFAISIAVMVSEGFLKGFCAYLVSIAGAVLVQRVAGNKTEKDCN